MNKSTILWIKHYEDKILAWTCMVCYLLITDTGKNQRESPVIWCTVFFHPKTQNSYEGNSSTTRDHA